jgi:glycerol-3-phosphate dehydrogenase (NAD(P)+)
LSEGIAAARHVSVFAEKYRLKIPISTGIYHILNREIEPFDFLKNYLEELGR